MSDFIPNLPQLDRAQLMPALNRRKLNQTFNFGVLLRLQGRHLSRLLFRAFRVVQFWWRVRVIGIGSDPLPFQVEVRAVAVRYFDGGSGRGRFSGP